MSKDWSRFEVEAAVAAYLDMLMLEQAGVAFNKAEQRRKVLPLLNGRTEGSIERKHQNISAVLLALGLPYVDGYKPLRNYQAMVVEVVAAAAASRPELLAAIRNKVDALPRGQEPDDILGCVVPAPQPIERKPTVVRERPTIQYVSPDDYLLREARNGALGRAGEDFVLRYERARLLAAERENLAADVEHVARVHGDGAGYDILSYEPDGRERLIEVKTTRYGEYTPFYVTANEVGVSRDAGAKYHLYRVYSFEVRTRLFTRAGALSESFVLNPSEYVARLS